MSTRKRSGKRTKVWCSFVEVAPGKWRMTSPGCRGLDLWRSSKRKRRRKKRAKR